MSVRVRKGNYTHALVACGGCGARTAVSIRAAGRVRCESCSATVRIRKGGSEAAKAAVNARAEGQRGRPPGRDPSGLSRRPTTPPRPPGPPGPPGPPAPTSSPLRKPKVRP